MLSDCEGNILNDKKRTDVEKFLHAVDRNFPIPLSSKQNIKQFAAKLCEKGTLCTVYESGEIVAMTAGYTKDIIDNQAYISIVATKTEFQGKGYATKLIKEFIDISRETGLSSIHLYTARQNLNAINLYKRIGFREWSILEEPRPDDMHLIFCIDM